MSNSAFRVVVGQRISAAQLCKHLFYNNEIFHDAMKENFDDTVQDATWNDFCEFVDLDCPQNNIPDKWTEKQYYAMWDFYELVDDGDNICHYKWKLESGKKLIIFLNTSSEAQEFIIGHAINLSASVGEIDMNVVEELKESLSEEGLDQIGLFAVGKLCNRFCTNH